MPQFRRQQRLNRNERIDAQPGLYSCAVQFSALGDGSSRWAQYADISETGMKLISTKPHHTEIGAVVDVNFSLVGGKKSISKKAVVVRQVNEFILGLQFLQTSEDFKFVFWQHARYVKQLYWSFPLEQSRKWFKEHKLGLRIALIAATFFIVSATAIYFSSDDYAGVNRSWGEVYSHQIDLNYVNGFNK